MADCAFLCRHKSLRTTSRGGREHFSWSIIRGRRRPPMITFEHKRGRPKPTRVSLVSKRWAAGHILSFLYLQSPFVPRHREDARVSLRGRSLYLEKTAKETQTNLNKTRIKSTICVNTSGLKLQLQKGSQIKNQTTTICFKTALISYVLKKTTQNATYMDICINLHMFCHTLTSSTSNCQRRRPRGGTGF